MLDVFPVIVKWSLMKRVRLLTEQPTQAGPLLGCADLSNKECVYHTQKIHPNLTRTRGVTNLFPLQPDKLCSDLFL